MAVNTGLGPSRKVKESNKNPSGTTGSGLYWLGTDLVVPGTGVTMEWKSIHTTSDFQADVHLIPQASQTIKALEISADATTSGYSGDIVVSGSVTLTVVDGLITTYA
jgi:hypothetical protein